MSEAKLSRPRNGCYAPPPNETGALHPAFSGSGFSASRCSLKANTQAARVSESRPIKRVLCTLVGLVGLVAGGVLFLVRTDGTLGTSGTSGTRMRRNQKDFFIR